MGPYQGTHRDQTPNTETTILGVSPRGISFVVERETTQIAC